MNSTDCEFVIHRAIYMPPCCLSARLSTRCVWSCSWSRLPGLNKVNWTNWVEIFFEQSTDITRRPDVADLKNFVLSIFTAYNITKNMTHEKKRSRHIGNFKNWKKTLRQDLDDLTTNIITGFFEFSNFSIVSIVWNCHFEEVPCRRPLGTPAINNIKYKITVQYSRIN